jgi:DNA polymerase IV
MRLSCSLGVATCKVVAKVASDARKPGGITVVPPGGEAAFLASLPVRTLPGVGPKAEVRLVAAGVATIGALAELEDARLAELLPGRVGVDLRLRARGIDPRPVSGEPAEAISISNEETFDVDVRDREELYAHLRQMSEGLAASLERRGMSARTVTTKVRYPDFAIATRSQSLVVGIDDAASIGDLACNLLDRALRQRPGPIRLVGVGVSGLDRHRQLSLPATDEPLTP